MERRSCIKLVAGISLLILTSFAGAETAQGPEKAEMDVETLLEKVRKAQRPVENMQIEWVSESSPAVSWKPGSASAGNQMRLTKYQDSAIISGCRSRIEERQETYYARDGKDPNLIENTTYVFDGALWRRLYRPSKGYQNKTNRAVVRFTDGNCFLLRQKLFGGDDPPIHDRERLSEYELVVTASGVAGVYVLDALKQGTKCLRLTIDANRGFNITKREWFRSDGSTSLEDNFELRQHPNNRWFISKRKRVRFIKRGSEPSVEEKVRVTKVDFDTPAPPDDTFKLIFPEGTAFYYGDDSFTVGCLAEPKHTKEDSAVTTILDGKADQEQASSTNEVLGIVTERVIKNIKHRKDCFVDFDTGRLISVPEGYQFNMKPEEWLKENSIDGRVETGKGLCGLWTFNTVVIPVSSERWDSITPAACHRVLDKVKGIYPPIMSAEGKLPATFLFQTWDNRGILQIMEVRKDTQPRLIRIRYKLIEQKRPGGRGGESAGDALSERQKEVVKKILSYEKQYETSVIKYTRTYNEPGKEKEHVLKCVFSSRHRFCRSDLAWENNGTKESRRTISNGETYSYWQFSNHDKQGEASIEPALSVDQRMLSLNLFCPFTFYGGNKSDSLSVESGEGELIRLLWKSPEMGLDFEATYRPEGDSLLPVEYVSSQPRQDGTKRVNILGRYEYEELTLKKITDPDSEEKDCYFITDVDFNPQFPDGHFEITFRKGTHVEDTILGIGYPFGRLRIPWYTQEHAAVTTILDHKVDQEASGTNEVFGSVTQRVINIMGHRKNCFIDLDTGRLLSIPDDFRPDVDPGPRAWLQKNGVDAAIRTEEGLCGLWTVNTVVIPVSNKRWDSITPVACHKVFDKVKGIYPPIMSAEGKLPATFLFQTWDNRGILQILKVQKDTEPRSIKVRYKIIQKTAQIGKAKKQVG